MVDSLDAIVKRKCFLCKDGYCTIYKAQLAETESYVIIKVENKQTGGSKLYEECLMHQYLSSSEDELSITPRALSFTNIPAHNILIMEPYSFNLQ